MRAKTALQRVKGKPYAETFRCPGGALCLDFCNTGQGTRGQRRTEWLAGFGDLVDWLEAAGGFAPKQAAQLREEGLRSPDAAAKAWERALRFREALFRVLDARLSARNPAAEDLALLGREFARAVSASRLARSGERYAWRLDPQAPVLEAALQPLAECAIELLTSDRLARVGECGNETCYWLFLDETKNRSRRWCEMASCGNLLKVRRHRERLRARASGAADRSA